MNRFKQTLLIYLKGMAMGGADVVPGVSGGTVAFITGIYEDLLNAIKAVDIEAFRLLFTFKIKDFWDKVNGGFLLPLALGILSSIFTLASFMHYLLTHHPIPLWSFFFGLIIVSSILVLRESKKWRAVNILAILTGAAIAYLITEATPTTTPDAYWFIFIAGAIAICAMILPGISGAFLLLILGKYSYMTAAISRLDLATIIVFAGGCAIGLLSFSRAVSWLLQKYHDIAIALLSGFMIGSLNKVWPWKMALTYRMNSAGEQVVATTKNIMPGEYLRQLNENPMIFQAVLFAALGIFIVVVIEKIANLKTGKQ